MFALVLFKIGYYFSVQKKMDKLSLCVQAGYNVRHWVWDFFTHLYQLGAPICWYTCCFSLGGSFRISSRLLLLGKVNWKIFLHFNMPLNSTYNVIKTVIYPVTFPSPWVNMLLYKYLYTHTIFHFMKPNKVYLYKFLSG